MEKSPAISRDYPTYSDDDVVAMVAHGRLVLSDLSSRRLSSSQVVIEVNNRRRVAVLTIPDGYEHGGLLNTILHSFSLPEYAVHLGISHKNKINESVKLFFTFLETNWHRYSADPDHSKDTPIPVPPHSISDWVEHLKHSETPSTVWLTLTTLLKILTRSLQTLYGKASRWPSDQKASWQVLKAKRSRRPPYKKNPPLGPYLGIPSTVFSNQELFMGLRYGVLWLLGRVQGLRELFLADPIISQTIDGLEVKTLSDVQHAFSDYSDWLHNQESVGQSKAHRFAAISPAVWQVIRSSPLLSEWQFYSWNKLRPALFPDKHGIGQPFSAEQQSELLARCINTDGSVRTILRGWARRHRVDHRWAPFKTYLGIACRVHTVTPCYWGTPWWVHTTLERTLMVWLLASERAQRSGIEQLTFDAVHISENRADLQISTRKLRRAANTSRPVSRLTDVESPIYKRGSPPYTAYTDWVRFEQAAHSKLNGHNPKRRMIFGPESQLSGRIAGNTVSQLSVAYLPLELVSAAGTVWQTTFLAETDPKAQREAQAFIAILQNRVAFKRANVRLGCCLPIDPIGQSLVVEQELEGNTDAEFTAVSAETMGHTEATGRKYKDGYTALAVGEILEPVQAFARKVGDKKMALAEQIVKRFMASARVVTLKELESLCGIQSTTGTQSDLLALLDEAHKLTIAGEILHKGELIIVETDMTAAMIWGYIQHLESHLPNLMLTDRDDTTIRFLTKLIYLHHIYERFSAKLQQSGKELADHIRFPFPPIA